MMIEFNGEIPMLGRAGRNIFIDLGITST